MVRKSIGTVLALCAGILLLAGSGSVAQALVIGTSGGGGGGGGGGGTTTPPSDVVTTFYASGLFQGGSALSGTVSIDTTAGSIQSFNLQVGSGTAFAFTGPSSSDGVNSINEYVLYQTNGSGNTLDLGFMTNSLVGFNGGSFASLDNPYSYNGQNYTSAYSNTLATTDLQSGGLSLTPVTNSVPEPGSLAIFGAGLGILAFGLGRRRRRRL